MWDAPTFAPRVIVTPGFTKYELLQNYRNELQKAADEAIAESNRFLFLGYGFNDSHLETYIRQKLTAQSCSGLIVTRDSNPRIESLLEESENLWLVCRKQNGLSDGTQIVNRRHQKPLNLPASRLWDISVLAREILGV